MDPIMLTLWDATVGLKMAWVSYGPQRESRNHTELQRPNARGLSFPGWCYRCNAQRQRQPTRPTPTDHLNRPRWLVGILGSWRLVGPFFEHSLPSQVTSSIKKTPIKAHLIVIVIANEVIVRGL
jgi:hypothetical protein